MPLPADNTIIRNLFYKGRRLQFRKTEVVTGNDTEPNGVYFIESGFIKSYAIGPDGEEYLHLIYGPGEVFPFIWAFLGSGEELVYFEALSDCRLWRISREWFHTLAGASPLTSQALGRQLARQFQVFSYRLDNLEYKKASQRVAYRLLLLARRFGAENGRGITIEAPITHELFGNSVNLTRESVSRQMEQLERRGIIKKINQRIVIKNLPALAGMLGARGDVSLPNSLLP